jgi:type IV secretory pathway VirB2 component (pilin)
MNKYIELLGNIAAITGVLVCLAAGLIRLSGNYFIFGFETQTLFLVSIAIMVFACLAKLHVLSVNQS